MGWLGSIGELLNALSVVNADKDDQGNYYVQGNITSFMGAGEEMCLGHDAQYRKNNEWLSLPQLLNSTSYGLKNVTVI